MRHLGSILTKVNLEKICDARIVGDITYYRLCERKTLNFLSEKIFSISRELIESESSESCKKSLSVVIDFLIFVQFKEKMTEMIALFFEMQFRY